MTDAPEHPDSAPWQTLRELALARLQRARGEETAPRDADVEALIHELQVHQAELEIQNEELRAAQSELAESRDRYAELYELAPVGYLTLDRSGHIQQINLTAAQLLTLDRSQLLAQPLSRFMPREDADLLHLHLVRVFETGRRHVCDLQLLRRDGPARVVRLESIAIEGATRRCWTIMSDITEAVQSQQAAELNARLRAIGTLAAGIAHELNNPLWMIKLQAEVALSDQARPDWSPKAARALSEIQDLVDRAAQIVHGVLRFANQEPTPKKPHSLLNLLRRARDYTSAQATAKGVTIELAASDEASCVLVNAFEIEQVFVNCLANAIQASRPGSEVRVAITRQADEATIRVEDDGCGMSFDTLQAAFDPFFTTRRGDSGHGLGLSISKRIVEEHDGTITITSQQGAGSVVTVTLPISPG
ncbi:MAG TPA: ATP-binding protein [Pirellulaceae bacterium]|nr:ATP-binding protein [Pirellulaceae bacterium]